MTNLPEKAYYRPDEITEHFRVSKKTVYGWIATGRLSATKTAGKAVRISREALQDIVEEAGRPPG